jgi:hypothetical protein
MTLSIVKTETPSRYTAPKVAVERYADYLKSLTLCMDYSVNPPSLFFANTRKNASVETIAAKFPEWAAKNKVWIEDYQTFRDKLTGKVKARLPHVFGAAFKPVAEGFFEAHEGIMMANTFVPFLPPPAPPAPAELMEYFERLFPNDDDRKYILQFFGHAFQFPLVRTTHAPLITGEQGNGKSTLPTMLRKAMGGKHVFDDNSYSSAFTQFSSILPDNMFVVFDDAKADRHTHGRLKVEITRKQQSVNVKFQQHPEERNVYTRVLVLSNSRTPMVMDNCRRFYATEFVTHTNKHNPEGTKANTDAFFDRFFEWLDKPESAAQLRQFFLSVNLEGFNPFSIPQTPTLLAMIGLSTTVLHSTIKDYVEDGHSFLDGQLHVLIKEEMGEHPKRDTLDIIKSHLVNEGYHRTRRPFTGWPKKEYVWSKKPPGKRSDALKPEDEAAMVGFLVAHSSPAKLSELEF